MSIQKRERLKKKGPGSTGDSVPYMDFMEELKAPQGEEAVLKDVQNMLDESVNLIKKWKPKPIERCGC